jgi:isocitrate dehydrogenase (NAD+)
MSTTYPARPTVTLLEGDGIGPEIADATVKVIAAAGGTIEWDRQLAGMTAAEKVGDPLPAATVESIKRTGLALKGPLGTPIGGGFRSVNVGMRQQFDLYANVRPTVTIPGVPSRYTGVDIVIVRENTEDLYAGVEHYVDPRRTAAESIAPSSPSSAARAESSATRSSTRAGTARKKITLVHKGQHPQAQQRPVSSTARKGHRRRVPGHRVRDDMIVDATAR